MFKVQGLGAWDSGLLYLGLRAPSFQFGDQDLGFQAVLQH